MVYIRTTEILQGVGEDGEGAKVKGQSVWRYSVLHKQIEINVEFNINYYL